jgi:hypothetical protein
MVRSPNLRFPQGRDRQDLIACSEVLLTLPIDLKMNSRRPKMAQHLLVSLKLQWTDRDNYKASAFCSSLPVSALT